MTLLRVKIDSKEINKVMGNAISYSYGFLDGIELDQILFNERLADFTVEALNKYIDSRARVNPEALHHIYEWNQVGNDSSRLFQITPKVSKRVLTFTGKFLPSKTVSDESTEPFVNKANIMENSIAITIEPKNSDVLAFTIDGETVFSTKSIYIANPGGDEVAGSFGRTVEQFFSDYFTNALLKPFLKQLQTADEYSKSFAVGTKVGNSAGIKAGRNYINSARMTIE